MANIHCHLTLILQIDCCVVMFRLAKEKVSYQQEADKQHQRVESLKAGGEDQYVIKKQVSTIAAC